VGDLRIKDLVVEYSSGGYAVRPIDHLNLEVTAGSLAILLGPSGCGKTTLLSCLGGILSPTSGRITFGDVDDEGVAKAIKGAAASLWTQQGVNGAWPPFGQPADANGQENIQYNLTGPSAMGRIDWHGCSVRIRASW
jgi:putative ABC transport system ATP-binding protein